MQDRYSGRSCQIACSMAVPSSLRLQLVECRFLRNGHLERRRLDRVRGRRVRRAVHADRVELPPPQMIDGDVVGDLEQPARELELRPVPVDVVQDLDEGVLREILGELAIADHAIDQREDRALIPADQLAKRRLAPCLASATTSASGRLGRSRAGGMRGESKSAIDAHNQRGVSRARLLASDGTGNFRRCRSARWRPSTAAADAGRSATTKRDLRPRIFSADRAALRSSQSPAELQHRSRLAAAGDRGAGLGARPVRRRIVDLCAGTLDVAAMLARPAGFRGRVLGADFAEPMLRAGREKVAGVGVAPVVADALDLAARRRTRAAGAIVAFGIRNVSDLDRRAARSASRARAAERDS